MTRGREEYKEARLGVEGLRGLRDSDLINQ